MLKKIFILIYILETTLFSFASPFQRANEEFSKKNYSEAEKYYLEDLKRDNNNVNTLFNLANVYLAQDKKGKALYSYYKASLINPYDTHIKNEIKNLEEELNVTGQSIFPLFISYMHNWYITLSLLVLISCIIFIKSLFKFIKIDNKFIFKFTKPTVLILSIILLISIIGNILYISDRNSGIVLENEDVLISPYADSDNSFTIKEGTKVYKSDNFNDYVFITDQKERYGWIKDDNIGWLWK